MTNSDFSSENININIPDDWNIDVGTAGTTVFLSFGSAYVGFGDLEFAGNGSELTGISQAFAVATPNNAIQTVTLSGATGGSFVLTFFLNSSLGEHTGNIAWDAPATGILGTSVQENLEALPNIGVGNVSVIGSAGGPYTIEFIGSLSNLALPLLAALGTLLTPGGATVTPAIVNAGGGTAGALLPETQYAVSVWVKMSATPAAGVLTIDLYNGSSIIQDLQGTNNSFTIALTGVSTSWLNYTGIFRTPYILPVLQYLRVRLSTALSSGKNVFINHLCLTPMTQVYAGGPSVACFSGATPFYIPDTFSAAITNDHGGHANLKNFQTLVNRLYQPTALGLPPLPSSASPTIADYT